MSRKWQFTLLSYVLLIIVTACGTNPRQVKGFSIPPRDIVFQAESISHGGDTVLAFVNADGSGLVYVQTYPLTSILNPSWSEDGESILFANSSTHRLSRLNGDGTVDVWESIYAVGRVVPFGKNEVLVRAVDAGTHPWVSLRLVSMKTGTILKTYVAAPHLSIGTRSWNGRQIVYTRWGYAEQPNAPVAARLLVLDTESGIERELVRSEKGHLRHPSFSPDGGMIAYVADDGIYLIPSQGGSPQRIKEIHHNWEAPFATWPPNFAWSPDGRWLVYHRCASEGLKECSNHNDYDIFKIDLETLEENLIAKGGVNPVWRPQSREKP